LLLTSRLSPGHITGGSAIAEPVVVGGRGAPRFHSRLISAGTDCLMFPATVQLESAVQCAM